MTLNSPLEIDFVVRLGPIITLIGFHHQRDQGPPKVFVRNRFGEYLLLQFLKLINELLIDGISLLLGVLVGILTALLVILTHLLQHLLLLILKLLGVVRSELSKTFGDLKLYLDSVLMVDDCPELAHQVVWYQLGELLSVGFELCINFILLLDLLLSAPESFRREVPQGEDRFPYLVFDFETWKAVRIKNIFRQVFSNI